MKDQNRPVFLDLRYIHFPVTAIVSIMHRLSGLYLAVMLPFSVFSVHYGLRDQAHFDALTQCLQSCLLSKFALIFFVLAYGYHALAGLRHMIMDCGWGLQRQSAVRSAYALLAIYSIFAACVIRGFLWA